MDHILSFQSLKAFRYPERVFMNKGRLFSLFRGLCPVRVPSDWVANPDKVRWASEPGIQYIDFTPNGGKAFAFSTERSVPSGGIPSHTESHVDPRCQEIDPSTIFWWGDAQQGGTYVEPYITMEMFGSSAKVIHLVPPEPDDGIRVFPPAIVSARDVYSSVERNSFAIDTSVPIIYWFDPDSSGGCGFFYACICATNGKAVVAYIGAGTRGWHHPQIIDDSGSSTDEIRYEDFVKQFPDARQNPEKIWNHFTREQYYLNDPSVERAEMSVDLFTVKVG